jgi:hypothetical protein
MKRSTFVFPSLLLATGLLGACQSMPTGLAQDKQVEIRSAAQEFTNAIRAGDAERLRHVSTIDDANEKLGKAVINDTVTSRKVLNSLSSHFGYVESKPGAVASNGWIDRLESTAAMAPIRQAGDRVLLATPDQGEIYLRNVGGTWKVELIPTLVPESGGKPVVSDPVVEYRFGVIHQLNQWMLTRLENNEFQNKTDFDKARSKFWMEYLTYAANGKDPQDTVLPSLPAMPNQPSAPDTRVLAGDR